jgi:hypothetical protein
MNTKAMYRQGDVLFVRRAKPRSTTMRVLRPDGRILEGEATGHIHRVAPGSLALAEVYELGEKLLLTASEDGISIVHEEHEPLLLPAGTYEVVRQREYSPEEIRNVAD